MAPTTTRDFDITILGATGWTATICAEYIAKNFPAATKWCIAGRSEAKIEALRSHLNTLPSHHGAPELSTFTLSSLTATDLDPLILKTKAIINGIGPYHRHSSPIVESWARNGTHYVDFSTETPWIVDMVHRYHHMATNSGAVIIPAISNSSSPSDLVAWMIVEYAAKLGLGPIGEVVCANKLDMIGMQGGSLHTVLDTAEKYGNGWWLGGDSWAISTQVMPAGSMSGAEGWFRRRHDALLGHLGTSLVAKGNQAVVQRSAGLHSERYGSMFVFNKYTAVAGPVSTVLIHLLTAFGVFLLGIPLFRTLMRRLSFEPGSGPDREASRRQEGLSFKAVAYAGSAECNKFPVAIAIFEYRGALTDISAILAVEAAASILELTGSGKIRTGGLLTPSFLGRDFVERLGRVGVKLGVNGITGEAKLKAQ